MQSAWAVGYAAAAAVNALVLPVWGWRAVFLAGLAPALLTLWIRRSVEESPVWLDGRARPAATRGVADVRSTGRCCALALDRRRDECRDDVRLVGALHVDPGVPRSAGSTQGGAGLSLLRSSTWIILMQVGMWLGYVSFGFIADRWDAAALMSPTCSWPLCSSRSTATTRDPLALLLLGPCRRVLRHRLLQRLRRGDGRDLSHAVRATAQGVTYNLGRGSAPRRRSPSARWRRCTVWERRCL